MARHANAHGPNDPRPHVVILGGGFGGLAAAKKLAGSAVRVTLVDRSNHHLFQPLLYQVATAALTAPDIAAPLRKVVGHHANVRVLMSAAESIDRANKIVHLDHGELAYDYLIVATGMVHNYFGHDEWEAHAPGLKTLREALDIRSRVLRAYEAAERETDEARRKELLTFVIIGAGPTGVEMAGALAEIASKTLARQFTNFDPDKDARVVLIEGGDRVLGAFSPESSEAAHAVLEGLGVEIRLNSFVGHVDDRGVRISGDDDPIAASTVVWAAGLKASPLTASLDAPLDRAGRVMVEPNLSIPGDANVYVLGDLIHLEQDGAPLPGVAQTAIQGGQFVARCILDEILGYPPRERFVYRDKGSMATIGRAEAVAEVGDARHKGLFAWFLWLVVHLVFLIDFRNRLSVLFDWSWSYITWSRSSRVILEAPPRRRPAPERAALIGDALFDEPATSEEE